ncbi:MAG: hypothetical protein J0M12_01560 [Deltaproteobacteria bacterium]|nr:hypothetical protein [Deltaproteobacteria bacterium]
MSLVSVSNFTAPFKNRVHFITIILVTIVFATLRLSGASIEVHSAGENKRGGSAPVTGASRASTSESTSSYAPQEPAPRQEVDGDIFLRELRAERAQKAKQADIPLNLGQNTQDDRIEDVMRPSSPPAARNRASEQTQADRSSSNGGSLSDIEKQLGLK